MVAHPSPWGSSRIAVELLAWTLVGALALLLALRSSPGAIPGGVTLGAGMAVALTLALLVPRHGRTVAIVPLVVALAILAAWAPVDPFDELVAGGSGVTLLLLLASDPGHAGAFAEATIPLLLPTLAVLLGVVAGFALPGISGEYGAAAALLAAVLLLAGWLYSRPSELAPAERNVVSATS